MKHLDLYMHLYIMKISINVCSTTIIISKKISKILWNFFFWKPLEKRIWSQVIWQICTHIIQVAFKKRLNYLSFFLWITYTLRDDDLDAIEKAYTKVSDETHFQLINYITYACSKKLSSWWDCKWPHFLFYRRLFLGI